MLSEHFRFAFVRGSGCRHTCECGKTFYHDTERGYDWEPGEFEELQKNAAAIPLDDSVPIINFMGECVCAVCDCTSVKKLKQLESIVWDYRFEIMDYIDQRSSSALAQAEYVDARVKKLREKIKEAENDG